MHNSSQLLCCLGNQINLLLPQTEYILSDVFFHDDLSQSDFSKSFCALSIHLDLFCIIHPNCSAVQEIKPIYCFLKLSTFSLMSFFMMIYPSLIFQNLCVPSIFILIYFCINYLNCSAVWKTKSIYCFL